MSRIEELERALAAEREARQRAVDAATKYEVEIHDAEIALEALDSRALFTIAGGIYELGRRLSEEREARRRAEARLYAGCQDCIYEPRNRCADQCNGCVIWDALVAARIENAGDTTQPETGERSRWTDLSDLVARSEYGA